MPKYNLLADKAGERLDLFLSIRINSISRAHIRNLIGDGKLTLNGKIEFRPHYKIRLGDSFELNDDSPKVNTEIVPENIPLEIIYEDDDLVVINKPAGLVVHPATGNWSGTLMNALHFHFKEMQSVGDKIRSGLIHRLDKDTSGLILVGKTNKGLWYYSKLFAQREVEKTYLAIVAGNIGPELEEGTTVVRNYIGRSLGNRLKFGEVPVSRGGRLAETKLEFMKLLHDQKGNNYSLLKAQPKTGRTHQIRVHLSQLGFPIIGDVIYGKNFKDFPRLMLHAWQIKLKLIDGKETTFEAPIPADFHP
jgi:23S rRNA pseudouridine1911/1915/1917 synthase